MAFSTTNVRAGTVGNLKLYAGDWSGLSGDASGSVTLSGGRVYFAEFSNQDTDQISEKPLTEVSISGSTITLTVHNHMDVTDGRFVVIYA